LKDTPFFGGFLKLKSDLLFYVNRSKTTHFLLRFYYFWLPQLAIFCSGLPFHSFFMAEFCRSDPQDSCGKSRHFAANQVCKKGLTFYATYTFYMPRQQMNTDF